LKGQTDVESQNPLTRDEIMTKIKEMAETLGRTPTYNEFYRAWGVGRKVVLRLCGENWVATVRACGLQPAFTNGRRSTKELFEDYCRMVLKLGHAPSPSEYLRHSPYTQKPLERLFRKWERVPAGLLGYAREQPVPEEFQPAVDILARHIESQANKREMLRARRDGRPAYESGPAYGRPIHIPGMAMGPTNEMGVLALFAIVAERLGFTILRVQQEFPDCEALRVTAKHCRRVLIEFEYESANFREHGHDPEGCDIIVCWRHNWEGCPLEVVELGKIIGGSGDLVIG
jgi:hypothetical protein